MVQRVSRASVSVAGEVVGEIGAGLCVLVGVTHDDTEAIARKLADRIWGLRQGAKDYLVKPLRPEALLETIGELLGSSSGFGKVAALATRM